MAFEAFLDSNSRVAIPLRLPVNGSGGLLETFSSGNLTQNDDHMNYIRRMAQLNSSLASDQIHSALLGRSSNSGLSVGHDAVLGGFNLTLPDGVYLQNHGITNMDPYPGLHSPPISISCDYPLNGSSTGENYPILCQGGQQGRKRQHLERTTVSVDLSKSKSQTCKDVNPVSIKQESGVLTQVLKRPRVDVNQENIQQQHIINELLLKELQDRNPQAKAMIMQHRQQNQLQQPILNLVPQLRGLHPQLLEKQMRNLLQDKGNQQMTFQPLLDGGICARRFMQYLYHLKNRPHDNCLSFWKRFVSEYYAPGSRQRWCFSLNEKIERHFNGVFSPKSMETWCCEICGSRSGKGLEANFELFPRLFKTKFESGMLDEILFLEMPVACRLPSGLLVLEYRKATQESIFERFRVVHEGKLRVIFRQDLKILSWEFCAQNHEEFLLRRLVAPQVNQLVQAAEKYDSDIRNGVPARVSSELLRKNCNMFVMAGNQLAKDVELPLVNDLGYPKRFIRCLQIAEVVNTMKDLLAFSHNTKMGPIESLNNYSQICKAGKQMKEKQGMQESVTVSTQKFQSITEQMSPRYHPNGYKMVGSDITSGSRKLSEASPKFNNEYFRQNSNIVSPKITGQDPISVDRISQSMGFNPQFGSHLHSNTTPFNNPRSQSSLNSRDPNQALINKLLQEMVASNRGNSAQKSHQNTFGNLLGGPMQNRKTSNTVRVGESSNISRTEDNFTREAATQGNISALNQDITIKKEPHSSPDHLPEDLTSLQTGFLKDEDLEW